MVELLILLGVLATGSGLESLGETSDDSGQDDPNAPTQTDGTDESERLDGGDGFDLLLGDSGDDTLVGENFADTLIGGSGDDFLRGGNGNDVLTGFGGTMPEAPTELDDFGNLIETPDPAIAEGFGSDTLNGGLGNDVLFGTVDANGDGNFDAIDEDTAADSLNGGFGDDTLYMGNGDIGTGGEGADTFTAGTWVDPGTPAVINDFNAAEDTLAVIYQPTESDFPETLDVTIEVLDNDAVVSLNGQAIMQVLGGASTVTAGMVNLIPMTLG